MIKYQKVDHAFQAKSWLVNGWNLFKKKPLTWVFMVLIFNILIIVGNSFLVGRFVVALLFPVLAGGIFIALHKSSRDEPIGLENLFSAFKDKSILKELLTVGLIGVAVVILALVLQYQTGVEYTVVGAGEVDKEVSKGSFFTSIVSLVWSCALLFGIPLIAINKESAIPALKHSLYGMLLNFVPFIVFFVMIILLTIVSIIPVGLGLLVLVPVLYGAFYSGYKEIYVETEKKQESAAFIPDITMNNPQKVKQSAAFTSNIKHQETDLIQEVRQSGADTNNKEHQETELKKTYQSIRVFRLVGIALVTIGVMIASYTYYSLQIGTNTIGEVVSVETHQSGSGSIRNRNRSTTYTPTFSFTDQNGEQHLAPTSYGSASLNYPVGARVKINYNPDDYSSVQINSVKSVFYIPMILWLLGGVLVWMTKKMKKNVDENGVPPRQSLFIEESLNSTKEARQKDGSQHFKQDQKQDQKQDPQGVTQKVAELNLPKKFTLNFYPDHMHITLSWFGAKTVGATLMAIFLSGAAYMFLSSGSVTSTGSPLMIKLLPWIYTISGLGFLYYTLTTWLNKTHIFVSQNAIEIKDKPLPCFSNKRIETKNIKQLYSKEVLSNSTSGNRRSSYELHILSFGEDDMRLLNVETSEQALFIEQEIEKYLGIENLKVRGEIG